MMDIRKWMNGEERKEPSKVDLVINEILTGYFDIMNLFLNENNIDSLDEFEKMLEKNKDKVYHVFYNWFTAEGKVFLEETAQHFYKDNVEVREELAYLVFILKSEANNALEYKEEVTETIIDVSDKVKGLVEELIEE